MAVDGSTLVFHNYKIIMFKFVSTCLYNIFVNVFYLLPDFLYKIKMFNVFSST